MKFMAEKKISDKLINYFDEKMTLELYKRLEENNHTNLFNALNEWHLLRVLAINIPELTSDYLYLLDQEHFYED